MKQMMEFDINIEGTPEEQEQYKKTKKMLVVSTTVVMPEDAVIRRIGTRIRIVSQTGIHPETKQIGTFAVPMEHVCIWAECEAGSKPVPRSFKIVPNGFEIPEPSTYVGSFLLQSGQLIFHLYG